MSCSVQLHFRTHNNFNKFKVTDQFTDVTLVTKHTRIRAHKIILARYCNYFKNLFCDTTKSIDEVEITYNPSDIFESFINVLYSNELTLNPDNFFLYLECSYHYGCKHVYNIVKAFTDKYSDSQLGDNSRVEMFYKLSDLNWIRSSLIFFNDVVQELENSNKAQKLEIYQHLRMKHLKKIIKTEYFSKLSEKEKILMFSQVNKFNPIDKDEDKELLASHVNLEFKNVAECFQSFDCSWIPIKIQRNIFNELIKDRRNELKTLEAVAQSVDSSISRWCVIDVLSKSSNCETDQNESDNDVIHCIKTYGGLFKEIPVSKFGFIQIDATPEIEVTLGPDSAFTSQLYYCSDINEQGIPHFNIKFVQSKVKCSKIVINSNITRNGLVKKPPNSLKIGINQNEKQIVDSENGICTYNLQDPVDVESIEIELNSASKFANCLRIGSIAAYGKFV